MIMADNITENDEDIYNISIQALRTNTKNIISSLLNPIKVIPTEKGIPRDWQGLAELLGVSGQYLPQLQTELDPTKKVLNVWCNKDKTESTIKKLLSYLEEIDRFDVIDDIKDLLEDDVRIYKEKLTNGDSNYIDLGSDDKIITIDDVNRINQGLDPQNYDAFVLFADDDIDFATEVIETMEKQYNLKFCVKDRDLVGGGFEHDVIIRLISERCNRLIVIFSPAFLQSPANKFFVTFAQAIGIENGQRKIIPCIYSQCKVPPELSCYFMLDYNRTSKLWNFWDKLHKSLQIAKQDGQKLALNRTFSNEVRELENNVKPIIQHHKIVDNTQKLKKDGVKFTSMVNLTDNESITVDSNLNPSTSANSLSIVSAVESKKTKKFSWIKKILHKSNKHSTENLQEKEKKEKKFWHRHVKRKLAVAN